MKEFFFKSCGGFILCIPFLPACIFLLSSFSVPVIFDSSSLVNGDSLLSIPKPLKVDNKISAHRGAYRIHGNPQNSLAAFQDAINLGVYASELDIQLTKDRQLIVNHDSDFKGLNISHSTYEELRSAGRLSNNEELPLFEDFVIKALEGKYTILMLMMGNSDLIIPMFNGVWNTRMHPRLFSDILHGR